MVCVGLFVFADVVCVGICLLFLIVGVYGDFLCWLDNFAFVLGIVSFGSGFVDWWFVFC